MLHREVLLPLASLLAGAPAPPAGAGCCRLGPSRTKLGRAALAVEGPCRPRRSRLQLAADARGPGEPVPRPFRLSGARRSSSSRTGSSPGSPTRARAALRPPPRSGASAARRASTCSGTPTPKRVASGAIDLVAQAEVLRGGARLATATPEPMAAGEPGEPVVYTSRIKLQRFEPGDYELRVTVTDRGAGAMATRSVPFTVEKILSAPSDPEAAGRPCTSSAPSRPRSARRCRAPSAAPPCGRGPRRCAAGSGEPPA